MPAIITLLSIVIVLLLLYIIITKIGKAIRKNDEDMWEDWSRIDTLEVTKVESYLGKGKIELLFEQHPWIDGDCCRCPECTDRYHKELGEDLTSNNK
jgi:hypothetical protein